jgi:hypothetical protein
VTGKLESWVAKLCSWKARLVQRLAVMASGLNPDIAQISENVRH